MSWSKVNSKHNKPLRWWLHKILCEYGWIVRNKDNYATYHHHSDMCSKLGYNLYGDKTEF